MLNRRPIFLFAVLAIYLGFLVGAARAAGVVDAGPQPGRWEAKTWMPPSPKDITS